jgi:polyphenol oxidase
MRDGPSVSSPLQWDNFVSTHAHHCTETGPDVLQVHWSWFFLPWHRAYLFFVERHLANILTTVFGDKPIKGTQLPLPYWDWLTYKAMPNTRVREQNANVALKKSPFFGLDLSGNFDPSGNGDPDRYNLGLYDGYRGPTIEKPEMKGDNEDSKGWKEYTQAIRDYYTNPEGIKSLLRNPNFCMFGGFPTISARTGQGLLESNPHNTVHDWVGSRYGRNRDMGYLRYAALDPVFCLHHGNIDRIWSLYPYTPDPDKPPSPADNRAISAKDLKAWGDQRFEFLDIDGKLVYVTVRDTIQKMKTVTYTAPATGPRLIAARPAAISKERSVTLAEGTIRLTDRPYAVSKKAAALLAERRDIRAGNPVSAVLEIEVGDFFYARRFQVRVFVNKQDADRTTPLTDKHFVGSFQVLDSHAGPGRGRADAKHLFFVDVSPGASNFFKVAPAGQSFDLRLVPIGSSSNRQAFFLNVTRITLRVYE